MTIVGRVGQPHDIVEDNHVVAWVIQGLTPYLNSRPTETIEIPDFYKNFEEDFGDSDGIYRGTKINDETMIGITGKRVMTALKTLSGGGLYSPEDYELVHTAPVPILKGPEGAMAIAPLHIRKVDS